MHIINTSIYTKNNGCHHSLLCLQILLQLMTPLSDGTLQDFFLVKFRVGGSSAIPASLAISRYIYLILESTECNWGYWGGNGQIYQLPACNFKKPISSIFKQIIDNIRSIYESTVLIISIGQQYHSNHSRTIKATSTRYCEFRLKAEYCSTFLC